jgi:hypothetical protein
MCKKYSPERRLNREKLGYSVVFLGRIGGKSGDTIYTMLGEN